MAVSKRLRFEVFRRDNHACRYCGATPPDAVLTIDHVTPTALGGQDEPSNLVTACRECNSGKTSMPADAALIDDVSADALRWAEAMRQVAAIREKEHADRADIVGWFNMIWCEWTDWRGEPFDLNGGSFTSIPEFLAAGLTRTELAELVRVAMRGPAKDKWRYFCGCCWKRIRQNQELAAELMQQEDDAIAGISRLETRWSHDEIDEMITRGIDLLSEHHDLAYTRDTLPCERHGLGCRDVMCQFTTAVSMIAFHLYEKEALAVAPAGAPEVRRTPRGGMRLPY